MYLVIFPEGTRYNPDLKNVIADSQAFASKEGTVQCQTVPALQLQTNST